MKNIFVSIIFSISAGFIFSCNNQHPSAVSERKSAPVAKDTSKFTTAMVDNKKDPSCGMPLTAGIGDTVHYKNKVLGFCSKECKDDFLKNPEKNISAAEMKGKEKLIVK